MMTRRFFQSVFLVSLATFAASCGGAKDKAAVGLEHSTPPRMITKRPLPRAQRLFAVNAQDRLVGPYLARGTRGKNVVAWVDSGDRGARRLRAMITDDAGIPIAPATEIVASAGDVTSLVAKRAGAVSDREATSAVLAWTALGERGETLRVAGVSDELQAVGPVDIARTTEDIVWVDIVPTKRGAVVLWAEETRDAEANVLAVAVDATGKPRGVPTFVARGVVGWHAARGEGGASLGVLRSAAKRKQPVPGYVLELVRIDDEARAIGSPLAVVAEPTVQPDFEMVRVAGGLTFAWTAKGGLEPEVKTIFVDDRDRVAPAARVGAPLAGARLLALAPLGSKGALVAYEEPAARPRAARRVFLTRAAGPNVTTVLELEGKGPPEIVPSEDGVVVLGRMRVCGEKDRDDQCGAAPFAPTALELDGELAPKRAERIEHGDPIENVQIAWSLACGSTRCMTLAVGDPEGDERVQAVLAAPLFGRGIVHRVVLSRLYAEGRPRPTSLATLMRTEPVAEVALAKAGGGSLAAVLTRGEESGAHGSAAAIYLVPVEKEGKVSPAVPLATRAAPAGGVSMATAPDGTIAVAWASREEAGARVRLARVNAAGKKVNDVLVTTRSKGDVSFVNVVAVEGGWIVGWVDGRDSQGEVYAAKVTTDLGRVTEHQRLTQAPGDASDLAMLAHPSGSVWLAWSDPRESPREGTGDIYAISVRAKDARKGTEEVRVITSAAHSRSPSLAPTADGVAIGWIEDAPIGAEAEGHAAYGAMLGMLDARGHVVKEPTLLRGAGRGAPVGIALDPTKPGTRGLLVRSSNEELSLDAFTLEREGVIVSSWLLSPEGPPTLDLALTLDGGDAVFAEEGKSAREHRVRKLGFDWGR